MKRTIANDGLICKCQPDWKFMGDGNWIRQSEWSRARGRRRWSPCSSRDQLCLCVTGQIVGIRAATFGTNAIFQVMEYVEFIWLLIHFELSWRFDRWYWDKGKEQAAAFTQWLNSNSNWRYMKKKKETIDEKWCTCGSFLSIALPPHFHIWLILMSCWASLTISMPFAPASYSVWIDETHINLTLTTIRFNQLFVNSVLCMPASFSFIHNRFQLSIVPSRLSQIHLIMSYIMNLGISNWGTHVIFLSILEIAYLVDSSIGNLLIYWLIHSWTLISWI